MAAGGWVEFNRVNGMALFTIYLNPYRKRLFSVVIMNHQLTNIFAYEKLLQMIMMRVSFSKHSFQTSLKKKHGNPRCGSHAEMRVAITNKTIINFFSVN